MMYQILCHLCTHAIPAIASYSTCSGKRTRAIVTNNCLVFTFTTTLTNAKSELVTQYVVGVAI